LQALAGLLQHARKYFIAVYFSCNEINAAFILLQHLFYFIAHETIVSNLQTDCNDVICDVTCDVVGRYELGETSSETLEAWKFWRTSVNVSLSDRPHTVLTEWNISAITSRHQQQQQQQQHAVSLAIYARRCSQPTHLRYDVFHVLTSSSRPARRRPVLACYVCCDNFIYTVGGPRATLFSTLTLDFLIDFYNFCTVRKRK